jgi:hypothetical protein
LLAGAATMELEAFMDGANVTGRLTHTDAQSATSFTVDLRCTRTTRDGWLLIGGIIESTTTNVAPQGTWSAIVLRAGSPVSGRIWVQAGGPTDQSPTCMDYLDGRFEEHDNGTFFIGDSQPGPLDGTLELRPSGTSAVLLASGTFVIRDWDFVTFEAYRDGVGAIGTLTARREPAAADYLRIDFDCLRATEGGLLVIGGFTAPIRDELGGLFGAIALNRGTPVLGQVWAYGGVPGVERRTDCQENADQWSTRVRAAAALELRDDLDGTFAFGP